MSNQELIKMAAKQALTEALGYDEARAYYLILNKKEQEFEKEFSYSKRYRLLKRLFELGAVGKIKPEEQDFFNYILLPPTFLHSKEVDLEIIEHLSKKYLENFEDVFEKEFSQIIIKDEKVVLLFLLKYFMKDAAKLAVGELDLKSLGNEGKKVSIVKDYKDPRRKIGIIDKNFAFEFMNMTNKTSSEYIGYIAKNNNSSKKDYVAAIEKEIGMIM
jgi:hypothetical protein